jgi:SanA protein
MKKTFKYILFVLLFFLGIIILLIFTCNQIIVNNAKGKVFSDIDNVHYAEYGLLLGTTPQTRIEGKPSQFFKFRIDAAEQLYKSGKIKNILISGDENSLDGVNEVECMRDSLVARGINANDIILDGKGFRTIDSVVRTIKVFNIKDFIVISQRFHNERTIYLAKHLGFNIIGFNAADATSNMAIITYIREYFARVKMFIDISSQSYEDFVKQ